MVVGRQFLGPGCHGWGGQSRSRGVGSEWARSHRLLTPREGTRLEGQSRARESTEPEAGSLAELKGRMAGSAPSGGVGEPEPLGNLRPHTWLLVDHVEQEEEDDADGDEGCPPGEKEHDDHGDDRPKERRPLAVVSE